MALFHIFKNITFQTRKKQLHIFQQFERRYFVDTKDPLPKNDHQLNLNFKPMVLSCGKLTVWYLKHLFFIIEFCLKTVLTYPQTFKSKNMSMCVQEVFVVEVGLMQISIFQLFPSFCRLIATPVVKIQRITYSKKNHCIDK